MPYIRIPLQIFLLKPRAIDFYKLLKENLNMRIINQRKSSKYKYIVTENVNGTRVRVSSNSIPSEHQWKAHLTKVLKSHPQKSA